MSDPWTGLEPARVWSHFRQLCDTPRPSKHEGPLRDKLAAWAAGLGLASRVDAAGNLLIRKSATAGRLHRPGVVLQGHLDMVCQQNTGSGHDFHRDPIRPEIEDGWLLTRHTTLGADNGIGVALALAALEADDIEHGPLEVLLTVDEEAGMGGARALAPDLLQGRRLINLDTEDWGELYVGCAGGLDVDIRRPYGREPLPPGHACFRLAVTGLVGGHSGIDIHRGRGNALKLLLRLLRTLEDEAGLRLLRLEGGTARNALPREASALVALPVATAEAVAGRLAGWQQLFREELAPADAKVSLGMTPATAEGEQALAPADQRALLAAFHAAPHGPQRMSLDVPGVVETSDNLGVLTIADGLCRATFMVRSLRGSASAALADEIESLFRLVGAQVDRVGPYPAWTPAPASPLLALCQQTYRREFGAEPAVKVIHAGLECGLIGGAYPDMDMISFGPDIRGAHAPGERVRIASVEQCWRLLKAMLAAI